MSRFSGNENESQVRSNCNSVQVGPKSVGGSTTHGTVVAGGKKVGGSANSACGKTGEFKGTKK